MYRSHGKAVLTISVKKLFKNVEKLLDKRHKMCYNEYVKRTEASDLQVMANLCKLPKPPKNKKNAENLLTNARKCAIIKSQKDKDSPKNQKGIDIMANKTTKMDNFNALLALSQVQANPKLVKFIEHEQEMLVRKAESRSNAPTVTQKENAVIAEKIPSVMESGKLYRLSEIKAMIPELTSSSGTQRIAAICRKLEESGVLVKSVDKRVIYYSLAD